MSATPGELACATEAETVSEGRGEGGRTTIRVLSRQPPLAAITVAEPGPTARSHPVAESIRATPRSVENQLTTKPGTFCPALSRTSATRRREAPGTSGCRGRRVIAREAEAPRSTAATGCPDACAVA